MLYLCQLILCLVANLHRRTAGQHDPGLLFERHKLIVELIVLKIAHDLRIVLIICF